MGPKWPPAASGAHRLQPFVPELLDLLAFFGELTPAPAVDKLLRHASAATLERSLAPARGRYPARGATTTRPDSWLNHEIPIGTFSDWDEARPGFLARIIREQGATLTPTLSLSETLRGRGSRSDPLAPGGGRDRVRGSVGRGTRVREFTELGHSEGGVAPLRTSLRTGLRRQC